MRIAWRSLKTRPASLASRILPTTTRFFSVTLISYLGEDSGMIAPGMHAVARVRFAPDSLADFDDVLVVQTEKESFPVPLTARRSAPSLTLPASLDAGYCFSSRRSLLLGCVRLM